MTATRARNGRRVGATILVLVMLLGFIGLGVWQIQRREGKLALIARVDARVHAPPVAAPPAADWPRVNREADEYRHLRLRGRFLEARPVLVQAVSELGAGFWVLAPWRQESGEVILVNRGFVPGDQGDPMALIAAPSRELRELTGLLRINEPGGGFLRANVPEAGRWYSRDVVAIASSLGLRQVAPYFVDEDAPVPAVSGRWPAAGLTVVQFRNHHMIYALTWFGLAGLAVYGLLRLWREPSARAARER